MDRNTAAWLLGGVAGLVVLGAVLSSTGSSAASLVAQFRALTPSLARGIVRVARAVGASPMALAQLIAFETAGTWSPRSRNPATGATGLIQFLPSTARKLGTSTEELSRMSAAEQLRWVQLYLELVSGGQWDDRQVGGLGNPQALWMAVFYPYARYWAPDTLFDAAVRSANPGISTPRDYMERVRSYARRLAP